MLETLSSAGWKRAWLDIKGYQEPRPQAIGGNQGGMVVEVGSGEWTQELTR